VNGGGEILLWLSKGTLNVYDVVEELRYNIQGYIKQQYGVILTQLVFFFSKVSTKP